MAGESEEKTLPASKKKIDDARKKGQVARSKDLTTGAGMAGALGFLLLGGSAALPAMTAMLDTAGQAATGDFTTGLGAVAAAVQTAAVRVVLPFWVIVPSLAVLASVVALRGIPFATDPLSPKMERLNPVEGLKRMFQVRALIELGKTLFKAGVIATAFFGVLRGGMQALVLVPACGLDCTGGVLHALAVPVLSITAGLFVVAGGVDVGLQRWLFMRDQKMGFSEAKRERKESNGNPEIKGERRRLAAEAARVGALGIKRATFLVEGAGAVIGLRYKPGETPVPLVVCNARGDRAASLRAEGTALRLPRVEDASLAALLASVTPGQSVPESSFNMVAAALGRAR